MHFGAQYPTFHFTFLVDVDDDDDGKWVTTGMMRKPTPLAACRRRRSPVWGVLSMLNSSAARIGGGAELVT